MDDAQRTQIGEFLRQGEWFSGMARELQEEILRRSILRRFKKGQTLQFEDGPALGLIAVLEGQVALLRHVGEEPALIHVAGPGFWFGEAAVFLEEAVVSAVAQSPVEALILPKLEYDRILADNPRHYPVFVENIALRLRILLRYFAETVRLAPEYRLRLRLADLADHRRADARTEGRAVDLDISQGELAQIVGLSRQRLNTRLKALESEGWIRLSPRRIRVLDPNGLRGSAAGSVLDGAHLDLPTVSALTRKARPASGQAPPSGEP